VIFVDTGAFLARHLSRDQHHASAVAAWASLAARKARLVTSNFVLDETLTLLARRVDPAFAVERGLALYASQSLTILRPDATDEVAALERMQKLADHQVGFTDAVSFVLMSRHGLTTAFTFDRHFADAGFLVWPG
jgi:predicted nucleic acid-binding protein